MLQTSASTPGRIDTRTNWGVGRAENSIRPAAFQNIHFLYMLSVTDAQTCFINAVVTETESVAETDSDANFLRSVLNRR